MDPGEILLDSTGDNQFYNSYGGNGLGTLNLYNFSDNFSICSVTNNIWDNSSYVSENVTILRNGSSQTTDLLFNDAASSFSTPIDLDISTLDNLSVEFQKTIYSDNNSFDQQQITFADYGACTGAHGNSSTTQGDGTQSNPFLISSALQLQAIGDNSSSLSSYYKLTGNIDLGGISWNPVGNSTVPFSGDLLGDNHTISNLTIASTDNYTGLFGNLAGKVSDLKLQNINVTGANYNGGLAGHQDNTSRIERVLLDNVSVQGNHTGGLVGKSLGLIEEVGIRGLSINASSYGHIGGLVGWLSGPQGNGIIRRSFVNGTITAQNKVGGLVGKLSTGASLEDSYAQVNVQGSSLVGSLVGSDAPYGSNSNQVMRNYSTGSVTYSTRGGGAIGDNETVSPQTIFENNYYDNVSDTSINNYPKATPATTAQLQQTQDNTTAIFSGWDFVNVWDPMTPCEYPRLRWENAPYGPCLSLSKTTALVSENGTTDNFTVMLTSQPSSNTVLQISSDNTSEVTVSPDNLTFTNSNWNTPQTVTLTGVDDNLSDGDTIIQVLIKVDNAGQSLSWDQRFINGI